MNLYKENPALKFQLGHPLMEKIVALKERKRIAKEGGNILLTENFIRNVRRIKIGKPKGFHTYLQ